MSDGCRYLQCLMAWISYVKAGCAMVGVASIGSCMPWSFWVLLLAHKPYVEAGASVP